MKPQGAHTQEERLLEFAYGELPPQEAQAVQLHVQGCTHCAQTLDGMRGVRSAMSRLPLEPAPEAGLDSLLAYAQQAARRAAAGPAPAPRWWRRWLVPVLGLSSVAFLCIVTWQINQEADFKPQLPKSAPSAVAQLKEEAAAPLAPPPAPVAAAPAQEPEAASAAMPQAEPLPGAKKKAVAWNGRSESPRGKAKGAGNVLSDLGDVAPSGSRRAPAEPKKAIARKDEALAELGSAERYRRDEPAMREQQVAGAAPPMAQAPAPASPPLRLGGSASLAEQVAGAGSAGTGAGVRSRASQPAAPAPSSAPAEAASALATSAAAMAEGAEDMAPEKSSEMAEVKEPSRGKLDSSGDLSRKAREARRAGDTPREAALLRLALTRASGSERVALLDRLCELELELGRREAALSSCSQLLEEAPHSRRARLARKLLEESQQPAAAKPASKKATAPAEADAQ